MYELPGKNHTFTSVASMDEDYQMIDSHIDENLKKKIWNLEYVDFSKLLTKGRHDED